jgi:hypothetical protein
MRERREGRETPNKCGPKLFGGWLSVRCAVGLHLATPIAEPTRFRRPELLDPLIPYFRVADSFIGL